MGNAIRQIKTVWIAGRLQRRIKAGIANAAAVIVHRLIRPPATDAARRRLPSVATPMRQHDFGRVVKKNIDGNCLHRRRLQRSRAKIGALKVFAMVTHGDRKIHLVALLSLAICRTYNADGAGDIDGRSFPA